MNRLVAVVVLSLVVPPGLAAASEGGIGRIKEARGETRIQRGDQVRSAAVGDEVFENDVLETGSESELGVTFEDYSRLSLGPDTTLVIDRYVYSRESGGSFLSRMTRGTLLYVSGLIAKLSPGASAVDTPVGTIGIRGTRFLARISEEDAATEGLDEEETGR